MSKIGFIGLGKLGLPVALSIENKGHDVVGYDINPKVADYIKTGKIPYIEEGTPELLEKTHIRTVSMDEVIAHSDIVFCPVQTPHHEKYEGITRLPKQRVNFDYTYLVNAIHDIAESCEKQNKDIILIIISTVLPNTIETFVKPILNKHIRLCYNPFFIAMGTTRADFENPEFVLLGCDSEPAIVEEVKSFYATIHSKPVFHTSIKNAELIKVVYNTYISSKISFITTIQEVCHKTGADIDAISDALSLANERIISTKYLRGGMPDGGGCHPRDNIALSWLAQTVGLSYDWFENIMLQREKTVDWYADLIEESMKKKGISKVVICGIAFKKGTNLTVGSPAILLSNILKERGIEPEYYDPHVIPDMPFPYKPAIFFIGTDHNEFKELDFPKGSMVIDVWGITKPSEDVFTLNVGRNSYYTPKKHDEENTTSSIGVPLQNQ